MYVKFYSLFIAFLFQNENCIDCAAVVLLLLLLVAVVVDGASELIESNRCHLELFCKAVFI